MSTSDETTPNDESLTIGQVLERDHHAIDEHFAAFGASLANGAPDAGALRAGTQALRHHIWVEEELHFPPLREAGLVGPILVMLREHGEIWDLLDLLAHGLDNDASAASLVEPWRSLEQTLADHNMKEERILYPSGDKVLDEVAAGEVRAALASGVTPDGWICEMAGRA